MRRRTFESTLKSPPRYLGGYPISPRFMDSLLFRPDLLTGHELASVADARPTRALSAGSAFFRVFRAFRGSLRFLVKSLESPAARP